MMSEKEKGKEKEQEEEIILHHFCHHHPLSLTQERFSSYKQCYGCRRYIFSGETAYTCRDKCGSSLILHEECAETPPQIALSLHPQHPLVQKKASYRSACAVCKYIIYRIGYYCSSSDPCNFQVHVGCTRSSDIIHAAAAGERSCMKHPSHPQHELTLLWMPGRAGPLRCNACGTLQKGNFYVCIVCQYVIHESCADLPAALTYHNHAHPLSLAYHLLQEYIDFNFKCDVCFKDLIPKNWLYHCKICRYIVHIKCATTPASPPTTSNNGADDVITFPINNVVEDLIEAFVKKVRGMVNIPDEKEMVKGNYKFHNPNHQLRLIQEEEGRKNCNSDDDDEEEEEEEDLYHEKVSKLVCDVCTEPIIILSEKKEKSKYWYISCEEEECKFHVHVACFQLPGEVASSLTNCHPEADHILTIKTRSKLDFSFCKSCWVYTNGLYYECKKCFFRADIKCVSLPATINHAAHHPNHRLKLLTREITTEDSFWQRRCGACGLDTIYEVCYRCETCGVIFHSRCCLLPLQVSNRMYDKHPLRLMFDATVNHPGEFYCDVCEEQMNPKNWMYHCRECDVSIHPDCFRSVSDRYRNVKFGARYRYPALDLNHPHPLSLRFQPLTNTRKPRCDVCRQRMEYGTRGFQCCSHQSESESECDFFMCYDGHDIDVLQAVDS